jgi:hypothetical protein
MPNQQLTRSYVITKRLDALLKTWARQSDRTASAELRQILEAEAQRRNTMLALNPAPMEAAKAGRK